MLNNTTYNVLYAILTGKRHHADTTLQLLGVPKKMFDTLKFVYSKSLMSRFALLKGYHEIKSKKC